MKCPKCGYNSFEFHDICKKCSVDLSGYKATHGLRPIVIPQEARAAMAAELVAGPPVPEHAPQAGETGTDLFSFDLPGEDDAATGATPEHDDPFAFINEPAGEPQELGEFSFDEKQDLFQSPPAGPEGDPADLPEAASPEGEDPFAVPAKTQTSTISFGELDLDSFSWEAPASHAETDSAAQPEHDLDKLFGNNDTAR
jgi:hypothetical protein